MKKVCFVLAAMIALTVFNSFTMQQQGWRFIGDKWAAFGPDRDVLRIGGNDAFRQVKIKITNGPLRIDDVDIYFENGEKMNSLRVYSFFHHFQNRYLHHQFLMGRLLS